MINFASVGMNKSDSFFDRTLKFFNTHLDRHVSAEKEVREKEEAMFKDVSEAYSVLSDSRKRHRYDNGLDLEMGGMGKGNSSSWWYRDEIVFAHLQRCRSLRAVYELVWWNGRRRNV